MIRQILSTSIGKSVKSVARLRGGGSALPGLVVEKIDSGFIDRTLAQLPMGVVIISGTNGKTTTTKIVVELLESTGLKVFTNKTGSNFSRGVAAALLGEVDLTGKLDADIAVLELDEAWAAKFVKQVKPRYSLLLNVMRDQMDRFGEIDKTAKLLGAIAAATTSTVVLNRDDPRIFAIAKDMDVDSQKVFFGTTDTLLELMPTDDSLKNGQAQANTSVDGDVILQDISQDHATFIIDGKTYETSLSLSGVYNVLNAAAALSLVRQILGENDQSVANETLIDSLSEIKPAFGRGEKITQNDRNIELILVKNPSGFRLALLSFNDHSSTTMIAVNDNYADGRDMSWLWDVDFSALKNISMVSGNRAFDMALRLEYDDKTPDHIILDLDQALDKLLSDNPTGPIRIFTTYTAMLHIRKYLSKIAKVKAVR